MNFVDQMPANPSVRLLLPPPQPLLLSGRQLHQHCVVNPSCFPEQSERSVAPYAFCTGVCFLSQRFPTKLGALDHPEVRKARNNTVGEFGKPELGSTQFGNNDQFRNFLSFSQKERKERSRKQAYGKSQPVTVDSCPRSLLL